MKTGLGRIALWCYTRPIYLVVFVQPMPGPHVGTGKPEVAER